VEHVGQAEITALGTLVDPTRRALYRYVSQHPGTGRDAAAAAVRISRPLAAYHLDRLVDAGLLSVRSEPAAERGGRSGRPPKRYERSPQRFDVRFPPRDEALVARVLARTIEELGASDALPTITRIARSLGTDIATAARGAEAIDVLRTQGYEPVPDSHGDVLLRNCPFHALVDEHRDLVCQMNAALVDGLLDGLDEHELHADLDAGPERCCVIVRRTRADDA
jgi:predicted ArsR family transcriptional regulator